MTTPIFASSTPQNSNAKDGKRHPEFPEVIVAKRARILNDLEVEVDIEIVYGVGISGLQSLIKLNTVFREYENTLFDRTFADSERSAETSNLNQSIKTFLLQLSPYFLRKSAQDCLEWLVRAYRINENNIEDMMALMLPYHETELFVKWLQTLSLNNRKSSWYWMKPIQKSCVILSKEVIIDKAANDPFFFEFILRTVNVAVNELNEKAVALQSWFAFYTIVTLGVLDTTADIKEFHVSNITGSILKGLSSKVGDFCAASMSIIGLLVTKIELAEEFLSSIIEILANICHLPEMKKEALITLVLIHQTQNKNSKLIIEKRLTELIDVSTIETLINIHKTNNKVLSLCIPLILDCLENIQNDKNRKQNQKFVKMWISELCLNNDDADVLIRCILKALNSSEQIETTTFSWYNRSDVEISIPCSVDESGYNVSRDVEIGARGFDEAHDEVINLTSDEEDNITLDDVDGDTPRASDLLMDLQKRYRDVYDAAVKDIMSSEVDTGVLLCFGDLLGGFGPEIVLNINDPSAEIRKQGVKTLINMGDMLRYQFSNDKMDFLVAEIDKLLSDSSPVVINEVLRFETKDLITFFGKETLVKKLKHFIGDRFMTLAEWQNVISAVINHITSDKLLCGNNEIEVFLAIWPYMFRFTSDRFDHTKTILQSSIAKRFLIFKNLQNFDFKGNDTDVKIFDEFVSNKLKLPVNDLKIDKIVKFVTTMPDEEITRILAYHVIHLFTHLMRKNSGLKLSTEVFNIVLRFAEKFQLSNEEIDENVLIIHTVNAVETLPVHVIVNCIQSIIRTTNFSKVINSPHIDYTSQNEILIFAIRICDHLCIGLRSESPRVNYLYNVAMIDFFKFVVPSIDNKLHFFSNFFINHYMDQLSGTPNLFYIDPVMQLRNMLVLNKFLDQTDDCLKEMKMEVFVRIMSGLTSSFKAIRATTCKTIEVLHKLLDKTARLSKFLDSLYRFRNKFEFSSEGLSMCLSHMDHQCHELFEIIQRPETTMIMKASLLNMLHDINDIEHLELIATFALGILTNIDNTEKVILDHHESIIIMKTIERFKPETISSISSSENCSQFFEKVLQQSNVFVQRNNELHISIPVLMMNFDIYAGAEENERKIIIESIIKSATFSNEDNEEIRSEAEKFFKQSIELVGKVETDFLTTMCEMISNEDVICLSQDLIETPEWRCGVTLLQFLLLQQTQKPHELLRDLFPVLQILNFNDHSIEYTKQLVLRNILNCFESKVRSPQECDFLIEPLVKCIRDTENPQTHRIALKLLTKLTTITFLICDDIMDIFTLPRRKDDIYSYNRICDTIESIVPTFNGNQIFDLLKKFSDVIFEVPSYRRSSLYGHLLNTLGPTKYLWIFLAVFFESYVDGTEPTVILMQIALDITNLFDCDVIIRTCYKLITLLQLNKDDKIQIQIGEHSKLVFNVSLDQRRLYTNMILHFINVLTGKGSLFLTKMVPLPEEYKADVEMIILDIMKYIKDSVSSSSINGNCGDYKCCRNYIKASLNSSSTNEDCSDYVTKCCQILYQLLDLCPDMLLQVVTLLGEDNGIEVRIKILYLFNQKLKVSMDNNKAFLSVLEPVTAIVKSIADATKSPNTLLQVTAVRSVTLSSKTFAKVHPDKFSQLLEVVAEIFDSQRKAPIPMRGILVECIGELCANLRIKAIKHVDTFMSPMKTLLDDITKEPNDATYRCFGRIFQGIYRIVETLSHFLSFHLVDLIAGLSIVWSHPNTKRSNYWHQNVLKLREIWDKLASTLGLRVLIPSIKENIYPNLLKEKKFDAIEPLMSLLLRSFQLNNEDVVANSSELIEFFLDAIEFRTKFHFECFVVDEQEDVIIGTFVQFFLRLSERSFMLLYNKLREWSMENIGPSYDRAVTFYRLSTKLAEATKQLHLRFATTIIQDAVSLLQKNFTDAEIYASSTKPINLIYNILATLHIAFKSSEKSIHRQFNVFMEPIVDLMNKEDYVMNEQFKAMLPKCLSQLAVAVNENELSKLQNLILLKTRSDSPVVKRCALICYVEVILNFGEDSTRFYCDLIPFFADILQLEDRETVDVCRDCIRKIEKEACHPLEKYF